MAWLTFLRRVAACSLMLGFILSSAAAVQAAGVPKVLVAGGNPDASWTLFLNTAEVYDPDTGLWSPTANNVPYDCTGIGNMTLLADGKAMFAGGACPNVDGGNTNTTGIYDPATNQWVVGPSMAYGKSSFAMVPMNNGNIMTIGGCPGGCSNANVLGQYLGEVGRSVEIYSLASGWQTASPLNTLRVSLTSYVAPNQSAVTLQDGRVLVAGGGSGFSTVWSSCELYDPIANSWAYTTGAFPEEAAYLALVLLPNGKVLSLQRSTLAATLFDPSTETWSATSPPLGSQPFDGASLTRLNNGEVLLAGGSNVFLVDGRYTTMSSTQIYNPTTGLWRSVGSMGTARARHFAILLSDGKVLVGGGNTGSDPSGGNFPITDTAEIFDPATETWSSTGTMLQPRAYLTATLLSSGTSGPTLTVEMPAGIYAPTTSTGSYQVSWDASTTPGVTYKLYEGATEIYSGPNTYSDVSGKAAGTSNTTGSYQIRWNPTGEPGVIYKLYEGASEIYSGATNNFTVTGKTNGSYSYTVKATKDGYVDGAIKGPLAVTVAL